MNLVLLASAPNTVLGNVIIASGAFIILIALIRVFAWKQITAIFENRAKKISDDIDAAEEAHQKADELVKKREEELSGSKAEAASIIQTANDTAAKNRDKSIGATNEEIAGLKARAKADIDQERKEALASVRSEVGDISIAIAAKLVGKNFDPKEQSALIDNYLSKLGE